MDLILITPLSSDSVPYAVRQSFSGLPNIASACTYYMLSILNSFKQFKWQNHKLNGLSHSDNDLDL